MVVRRLYSPPLKLPRMESEADVLEYYGEDWFEPQEVAIYLVEREQGHRKRYDPGVSFFFPELNKPRGKKPQSHSFYSRFLG